MTATSERPVVVVTGAATGIGLALSADLARTHRVAMLGHDETEVRDAAADLGEDVRAYVCDITVQEQVEATVAEVIADFGRIDAAVSNAGIGTAGIARHLHPDVLATQLEVNLTGNWRFVHACLPELERTKGYVLGVASGAAILAPPSEALYAASKAGLEALLDTLRVEVAHLGIDVGVAYLMFVDTPMVRAGDRDHPDLAAVRVSLPGAGGKTYSVAAAASAIAAGVRGRRKQVFVPSALRRIYRMRGIIRTVADRKLAQLAPRIDELTAQKVAERGSYDAAFDRRTRAGIAGDE